MLLLPHFLFWKPKPAGLTLNMVLLGRIKPWLSAQRWASSQISDAGVWQASVLYSLSDTNTGRMSSE